MMKKTGGWVNSLFALVFIAVPAMIGYLFYLPGWGNNKASATWIYWVGAVIYLIYVALISYIFISLKILGVDALNFNIPMSLVFVSIFVSFNWHIALRALTAIIMVFIAWPINSLTNLYYDKMRVKIMKNSRKQSPF